MQNITKMYKNVEYTNYYTNIVILKNSNIAKLIDHNKYKILGENKDIIIWQRK